MGENVVRFLFLLISTGLLSAPAPAIADLQADGYTLSVVGTLPSPYNAQSTPDAINDRGQVLINSGANSSIHAAIYTPGSPLQDLGTLPAPYDSFSYGTGLNYSGQASGLSWNHTDSTYHGFLYSGGSMTDLGTLPGYSQSSQARAINNSGEVVGDSETATTEHAFLYSGNRLQDLGTLPGTLSSTANAISNNGMIAGTSFATFGTATDQAFVIDRFGMRALGTLPGPYDAQSDALGINDEGDVVGASFDSAGNSHAVLWSNGVPSDLGTLPGFGNSSVALQINNAGQIIGYSQAANGATHDFLISGGVMTDLNQEFYTAFTGWQLEQFVAINGYGAITAAGYSPDGVFETVVLDPAPEPAAGLTVLAGIALLAMRWRVCL